MASLDHAMCHPILNTLKNVKFRLSRNLTKFDVVARFRETIQTMKSVSSSEIKKIMDFNQNYCFTLFQKIWIFRGSTFFPPSKNFVPKFHTHTHQSTCICNPRSQSLTTRWAVNSSMSRMTSKPICLPPKGPPGAESLRSLPHNPNLSDQLSP